MSFNKNKITVFPLLELVTSPTVNTNQAAYYLNRSPNTLRVWASTENNAPILPGRLFGKLTWSVKEIRELLGITQS